MGQKWALAASLSSVVILRNSKFPFYRIVLNEKMMFYNQKFKFKFALKRRREEVDDDYDKYKWKYRKKYKWN